MTDKRPDKIRLPTNDNLRKEILEHLNSHPVEGVSESDINKLYGHGDGEKNYRFSPTEKIELHRMAAEEAATESFKFPNKDDRTYTGSDFVMVELCKNPDVFPFSTDFNPYETPFANMEPGETYIFTGVDKTAKVTSLKKQRNHKSEPHLSILGPDGLTYENMIDASKGKLRVAVENRFAPVVDYLFRHEKAETGCDYELDRHVRSLEGFVMRNKEELTREDLSHLAVDVVGTGQTASDNELTVYRQVVPTFLVLLKVLPKNGNESKH